MVRPETSTTAANRFIASLDLEGDDVALAKAALIRALADQIDSAKSSENPSVVRSVPTLARQLTAEIDSLADHVAPPVEEDSDRFLAWLMSPESSLASVIANRLGFNEAERRWLLSEPYGPDDVGDYWTYHRLDPESGQVVLCDPDGNIL